MSTFMELVFLWASPYTGNHTPPLTHRLYRPKHIRLDGLLVIYLLVANPLTMHSTLFTSLLSVDTA